MERVQIVRTWIRWQCDLCSAISLEDEDLCRNCRHERCDQCIRYPPVSMTEETDEGGVKALEEEMEKVGLEKSDTGAR